MSIEAKRPEPREVDTTLAPARPGGVQSVERALALLELLAEAGGEASLAELSQRSGLNVSTCHHLLATLVARNYVTRGSVRGSYAMGAQILALAGVCSRQVDLPRRAEPFIDQINQMTGETVHLAVLQGDDLVTLLKRDARHAVRVDAGTIGKSAACHATATGKSILAWLPEDETRRILQLKGMTAFTPATITQPEALLEELRLVRRNGFAEDHEEFQPHVVCVGAAIRDHGGAVVGAISASTPLMRASGEHLALMRQEVVSAARDLSAELGSGLAPQIQG